MGSGRSREPTPGLPTASTIGRVGVRNGVVPWIDGGVHIVRQDGAQLLLGSWIAGLAVGHSQEPRQRDRPAGVVSNRRAMLAWVVGERPQPANAVSARRAVVAASFQAPIAAHQIAHLDLLLC